MNFKEVFSVKRIAFIFLFFILALIGSKVNFSAVLGAENQFFTLFQFFGPIAGSFLGPIFGVIAVLFSEIADFLIVGKEATWINLFRLLPMLLAVYYFGSKKKTLGVIVPLICIALFILHPIGRGAWFYSLYWLIPVIGAWLPEKAKGKLLFKSFGATFTAHAIGSVLWLYTVPMEAGQWIALIPITAYERFLFGLGIAGSYILFNTVLDYILEKRKIELSNKILSLDKRYTLLHLLHLKRS